MEEVWKDVVGYEGLYMVSNFGRIKSLERNHIRKSFVNNKFFETVITRKEKILSSKRICKGRGSLFGYIKYRLFKNGEGKNLFAHKIVANAFLKNPENKNQVDHIDGNSLNNTVENLKWVTSKENNKNKITVCRHKKSMQKYYDKNCLCYKGTTVRKYCEENGLTYSCVLKKIRKYGYGVKEAIEYYEKEKRGLIR